MLEVSPRVLEIGMFCLFKQAWPETTDYFFAGPERFALESGVPPRFHPGLWFEQREYDLVVAHTGSEEPWRCNVLSRLFSGRHRADAVAALAWELTRQIRPRMGKVPLAVLDMHDERAINGRDISLLRASKCYFKRELSPDPTMAFRPALRGPLLDKQLSKLRPISLGLSASATTEIRSTTSDKSIDVFFAGDTVHGAGVRGSGLRQLRELAAAGFKVDIAGEPLPRAEFFRRCARAWLVWSPQGLGWDCFRHYEAAACASVPLINQPTIRRYRPLRDGEHALYYPVEEDGLTRTVLAALKDLPRLASMSVDARAHVLKYHTHLALCEYVIEQCIGKRGEPSESRGVIN